MKHSRRIIRPLIYVVAILAAVFVLRWVDRASDNPEYVREFGLFGTYGRLTFWARPQLAKAAADEIQAELTALHTILNNYSETSELSRLNRTAFDAPFKCSPELWEAIEAGRKAYDLSDGAFDISIGALMDVWGFHRRRDTYPADEEVQQALSACGLDKITFNENDRTVKFSHPETRLDFGGIAKGYGLDIAARIAEKHGISAGMIDLGGNVYCLPKPPPGKPAYTVGIRNPFNPKKIMQTIPVLDQAVATSGNYENYQYIDGKFVHHIIDPATGYPVERTASVTFVTPTGLLSDVYSTAVFVNGAPLAERLGTEIPRTSAIMIKNDDDGAVRILSWKWPRNVQQLTAQLTKTP